MDTLSLHTIPLAAGQCLHLAVDAGTVLVAAHGSLRVDEAPRWLADRLVPVGHCVGEGQAYVVQQSGWLAVTAQGEARLAQVPPAGLAARTVEWMLRWRAGARPVAC